MLGAHDLAQMRTVAKAFLAGTATVKRISTAPDGTGGYTESRTTVATVPCRLAPAGLQPQERIIAEQIGATSLWRVSVPQGTDVLADDEIVIGSRTFQVVQVISPTWEVLRVAICRETL